MGKPERKRELPVGIGDRGISDSGNKTSFSRFDELNKIYGEDFIRYK